MITLCRILLIETFSEIKFGNLNSPWKSRGDDQDAISMHKLDIWNCQQKVKFRDMVNTLQHAQILKPEKVNHSKETDLSEDSRILDIFKL